MNRCVALPSHSQLFETYNLVEKGDVLIPSTMIMTSTGQNTQVYYREDQNTETTKELLTMIRFEGSVGFQAELRKLCEEYIDVFSTRVRH